MILQTGINAVAAHQMVIKNSPGHAARAVKAGRAEAVTLHSIDLYAALCIDKGPEQDAAQCTAVFHRRAQICNEGLQHGVDAIGAGTAGNKAFHFQRGQPGQLRCNALGQFQAVQGILAAMAPRAAGIVHLCPQDDRILHAVGHAGADSGIFTEQQPRFLPQPEKQSIKHYFRLQSAQRISGASIV